MKICAIICEFNPFHNGHKYLLERAREISGCDKILCIMSGSFTQRGEMCIFDKYTRAEHAILGGADCVIELPTAFAVAPAEIFAKGAIKILSSIPEVTSIAFGCESGDKQDFLKAVKILKNESDKFKNVLTKKLDEGESYIKSYTCAFESCGGDVNLLSSPNNVLGLEYAKALDGLDIDVYPIKRLGSNYNDTALKENFSSASAIRQNLTSSVLKTNVPPYVYKSLKKAKDVTSLANEAMRQRLFFTSANDLKRVYGCTEGLENKLKSLMYESFDNIIAGATSKRYSSARIKRILCANMLGLYADASAAYLNEQSYIKVLAVKAEGKDEIMSSVSKSIFPVIADGSANIIKLSETAHKCYLKDVFAHKLRSFILKTSNIGDSMILV